MLSPRICGGFFLNTGKHLGVVQLHPIFDIGVYVKSSVFLKKDLEGRQTLLVCRGVMAFRIRMFGFTERLCRYIYG